MSARSTISVFACGMSRPDSMIVVETSTSASPRRNAMHLLLELALAHLPVRDEEAQLRDRAAAASRPPPRSSRRGCGGRTTGRRARCSRSSAVLTSSSSYSPTCVRIGRRPSGGVSMIEMSRRPDERHVQRARDRRRGEREHVDLEPQLAQQLLLRDAEALLLVDDHEAEVLRDHVAREHAVRADQDVDLARRRSRASTASPPPACGSARPSRRGPGSRGSARGTCSSAAAARIVVGDEHQRLLAVDARPRTRRGPRPPSCRSRRRRRRAGPSGAAPRGPPSPPRSRAAWSSRLAVRELRLEPLEPVVLERSKATPGACCALRVEREQLAGELADATRARGS